MNQPAEQLPDEDLPEEEESAVGHLWKSDLLGNDGATKAACDRAYSAYIRHTNGARGLLGSPSDRPSNTYVRLSLEDEGPRMAVLTRAVDDLVRRSGGSVPAARPISVVPVVAPSPVRVVLDRDLKPENIEVTSLPPVAPVTAATPEPTAFAPVASTSTPIVLPKPRKRRGPASKLSAVQAIDAAIASGQAKRRARTAADPFLATPRLASSPRGLTFRWRGFVLDLKSRTVGKNLVRLARKES